METTNFVPGVTPIVHQSRVKHAGNKPKLKKMKITKKKLEEHSQKYHYYLGIGIVITSGIIFLFFKY
jgi:hypothetical protein